MFDNGNYFEVESDGSFELLGDAVVWDDLRVPVTSTTLGGTKDPGFSVYKTNGSGSQGVFLYFFDNNTEEELYFTMQIPHCYKFGTDLSPHLHMIVPSTGAAGQFVRWGLEYTIASIGDSFSNTNIIYSDASTATTATSSGDSTLIADKHYLVSFPNIDGSAITSVSTMLLCRLFRDATDGTDDYPNDAGLLEFDCHFQIDTLGSRLEYIK